QSGELIVAQFQLWVELPKILDQFGRLYGGFLLHFGLLHGQVDIDLFLLGQVYVQARGIVQGGDVLLMGIGVHLGRGDVVHFKNKSAIPIMVEGGGGRPKIGADLGPIGSEELGKALRGEIKKPHQDDHQDKEQNQKDPDLTRIILEKVIHFETDHPAEQGEVIGKKAQGDR